nr:hypothetical protein [Tanacetum cinerariifolium]
LNGPYVRKMIPEPGDANRDITVTETFHLQTDDELSEKELKQIKVDDQAIQTILLGLPEDIYAAVDSCETAQDIWLRVQQMMKGSNIGIQEKKAKLFNEWEREDCKQSEYNQKEVDELKAKRLAKTQDPLALMENSNNPYAFLAPHQDQSSFNQNYLQQPMPNPEDITNPTTAMNMALALMAKAFKLNYSTPTNNNQRISSNLKNRQIAQPGMNMGQDRQMKMVGGNGGNQFRQYARQNAGNPSRYNDVIGNQVIQNAVQNPRVQNVVNLNGLIGVQGNGNQNQIGNGNLVAARAEGNAAGQNENQIRCYNRRGVGHYARNCTPEWSRHVTIVHQTKDLHTADYTQLYDFLKYNQKENAGNPAGYNDVIGNHAIQNIGNGNLVAARAEGNAAGQNGNQIRCYNCKGVGHYARNCTVKPRRRDAAYLQTQLLIAQKEEVGIQLQAEEYDLMAAPVGLDEIEEVNANCILTASLHQASTSSTQTDSAPVYDTDGSA